MTNQRIKILEYLRSTRIHPGAERVYEAVKKDMPAISLATVYRNLNVLAEEGEILKFEVNGEAHYDGFSHLHSHFVCNGCGKIIDIELEEIPKYALKKVRDNDLEVHSVKIIFDGLCRECRRNKNE